MSVILTCHSLCLGYENREVLHGLDLRLEEGQCLSVLGENGAGKSTLLHALLGLKKPSRGSVEYGAGLSRRQIGYLPQQSAAQKDFPALAGEVVRSGLLSSCGARAWYTRGERRRALEAMELLGVREMNRRSFRELSGGQQRRVLLARALCATQKLLLLDEPGAGLDPVASQDLAQAIRALHRTQGISIVMVSHDIATALREADLVLHLVNAHERFLGTPDAYRASETGARFLGNRN
ncbi:MAG: ATP-binding cassette domain-containing protein [Oscillospiraceae bacterium]|jgi:zinc transport system ATP-binding protein|nr:ATP-binding cassette domain-containing protein [Oscillospiraceae bacterium]